METALRALLANNGVNEKVIEWLAGPAQRCRAIKAFANWVSNGPGLQAAALDHTELSASRP